MKISPSMLSADFADLKNSIARVEPLVDMLHLDVMDGSFVPNMSFGPCVIEAIRPHSRLFFDVHLMIDRPERYIEAFRRAGADGITIHYESTKDPAEVLKAIRALGASPAISISPNTPAEVLYPLLPLCDMVLIMTVHPGFGGQKLIPETLLKVKALKQEMHHKGRVIPVEADGGIGTGNLKEVLAAGVDVIVAGSAIFGAADPVAATAAMREIAREI